MSRLVRVLMLAGSVVALAMPDVAEGQERVPTERDALYHGIWLASQETGIPAAFLVCVSRLESGMRLDAVGDNGRARGAFQWHQGTFAWAARGAGYGPDVAGNWQRYAHHPVIGTRAAAWLMSQGGASHWSVTPRCRGWWR